MLASLVSTVDATLRPVLRTAREHAGGTARALDALARSGVIRPVRPDRLARMAAALGRYGFGLTAGYVAAAARHPDRPAVIDEAGTVTFAELHLRTDRLARALATTGVAPGVRLGLLCRNHRGPVETMVAAGKLGADVVLLNPGLSAGQFGTVAAELALHTVVADAEYAEAGVLAELPAGCAQVLACDTDGGGSLEDLVDASGPGRLPLRPPSGHTIVLTSGTTGPPKGARRPDPGGLGPVGAVLPAIPMRAAEAVHVAAPLLHTWGHAALQLAVLHGAPVVLTRRFDPATFLDVVQRHRCTAVFAVPVMLQRVLELPAGELDAAWARHRPRVVAVSGSALPAGLAAAFMDRFGEVVHNLYGSTEASWVSIAGPADLRAAPGTAGRAPAGTRLVILGDDDRPVPAGVEGRVFVGNGMPFEGYTREGVDVERLRDGDLGDLIGTGDLGRLDEDGRLFLTGRADDMIVSGGENVHPGPVEDLLGAREEIREAAVVGVPDGEYGQRLAAFLVVAPGHDAPGAATVRGWVRDGIGRFAVPRDVHLLDALPRNATGKVLHRELRDQAPDQVG